MTYKILASDLRVPSSLYAPIPFPYDGEWEEKVKPLLSWEETVKEELLYNNEQNPVYQDEDGMQGSKIYKDYIGKVVRHFKGNYYYIENICMDSETKEYIVVYRTLYKRKDSNFWTRSAKMFFEEVDPNRDGNITHQTHRFEVVDDLEIDYTK